MYVYLVFLLKNEKKIENFIIDIVFNHISFVHMPKDMRKKVSAFKVLHYQCKAYHYMYRILCVRVLYSSILLRQKSFYRKTKVISGWMTITLMRMFTVNKKSK